ncbi:MAG TPA: response regulator, partial [Sumerlaeia bacterium]|nr:response regulator [Sumerlaeia bacterium]
METGSAPKKTVLVIDDDLDIRAALRMALVAEGFVTGEAGNAEEGLRVAEQTRPDAVIVDLMMEAVDSGATFSRQLKDRGYGGPIYMLSSAGDSVRYNLDTREMGLAGIFQKPVDPRS